MEACGVGFQGVRRALDPAYASSQPFYSPMGQRTLLVSGLHIEATHEFFEEVVTFRAGVRQRF